MGTAVVALLAFATVLGAAFSALEGLGTITSSSADALKSSWGEAERTVDSAIDPIDSSVSVADVSIVLKNSGRLKYSQEELADWEVIVRYQDTLGDDYVEYISYADVIATGSWTVSAIYLDESTSTTEIYEPGIFNPSEEMEITARLAQAPGAGTINSVTITPPEGGGGSIHFDG